LITQNSEKEELVTELMIIAGRTRTLANGTRSNKSKGLSLGRERKDHYVNELFKFMKKESRNDVLCERLLSAMIEARSCERFGFYQRIKLTQNWPSFIVIY
jgi:tRNA-(ms[2]io[6]A)-hydroxylase